ncbi:MAG: tetratricopeptide repeat protein [Fimbriimonadaceae bacterium]|nr:tetratricopeptide repeat protein [Fimbriimonadaceae bacterium]
MMDAFGDEARPLGTHERRLQRMFGDTYPRASVPKPKGFFPLPSDRRLANLVTVVQNGLVASSEEGFKDYEYLLGVADEILDAGVHYPTAINRLAILFALRRDLDEVRRQGEILLAQMTRHLNGNMPGNLIETAGQIEHGHLVHYAARLQNNLAAYAYDAGDLDEAREYLANAVALQEVDPSTPELTKLDRQYALAGVMLEEAYRVFAEAYDRDLALGQNRLRENADDHPLLNTLLAVHSARQSGDRR